MQKSGLPNWKQVLASINYTANFGRVNNLITWGISWCSICTNKVAIHLSQSWNVDSYSIKGQIVFKHKNGEIINEQSSWNLSEISIHCHFASWSLAFYAQFFGLHQPKWGLTFTFVNIVSSGRRCLRVPTKNLAQLFKFLLVHVPVFDCSVKAFFRLA